MKKPVDNPKELFKKQALEKNKDYQLQSNDISNGIYSCSPIARRLIAFCISKAYEDTIEIANLYNDENLTEKAKFPCMKSTFSFSDFFKKMGMIYGSKQIQQVEKAVDECMKSVIRIEQEDFFTHRRKWFTYTWFVESFIDEETEKINMTFNPLIYKAIVAWYFTNKGYSALRIELLGQLKSFYAMRYYEMALSQMGNMGKNGNEQEQWFFEKSIAELKAMFEIQNVKSYERTENFIMYVVKRPIEELNEKNKDFQIEIQKIKEQRKTVGFRFWCKATTKQWKIAKTDSYDDKQIKSEINEFEKEIVFYKTKFSKLWKEKSQEVKQSQFLPFNFEINEDIEILNLVKEELSNR